MACKGGHPDKTNKTILTLSPEDGRGSPECTSSRLPMRVLESAPYFQYIGNMEENDAIRSLAALAHTLRLRVFRMLVVAGPAGLTPGVIAEQLDVPGATLSFHLKELMNAQLVTQERDGRSLIYRAAFDQMDTLLGFLTENCCQGEPCLDAATCKC